MKNAIHQQRPHSSGKNKRQKPSSKETRPKLKDQFFPSKLTIPPNAMIKQNFFIPQSLLKKASEANILFNVAASHEGTKYKIVKDVGQYILSWGLTMDADEEWDVAWFDSYQDFDQFDRLKPYQKINFFPGIACLARKDHLSRNLARLQKRYPSEYDFFPETYVMPMDYEAFRAQFEDPKKMDTYIVKPQASSQGKGIFLTQTWKNVPNSHRYIAQRYISNPYLLDDLKFDLRIYALLTSCDPMKIYLFKDGLVRFATEKYQNANPTNINNMYVHLTNYAINKNNANFVFNTSEDEDNFGHKRSIHALFKILEHRGHNVKELWENIKKIVVKTFCTAQFTLSQKYKRIFPRNNNQNTCFQIFGFDIMIDENVKPWLLEVNSSPSLSADTPLDRRIKEKVIGDAFKIVNVSPNERINYKLKQKAEELKTRLEQIYQFSKRDGDFTFENQKAVVDEAEIMKTNGYEQIYPVKEDVKQTETYTTYMKEIKVFRPNSIAEPGPLIIKKEVEIKKQFEEIIVQPLQQNNNKQVTATILVKRPKSSYNRVDAPKNRPPDIEAITSSSRSTRARNAVVGKSVNLAELITPRKQQEVSRSLALQPQQLQKKEDEQQQQVENNEDARTRSVPIKYEMPQKVILTSPNNALAVGGGLPKIFVKEGRTNSTEEDFEVVAQRISHSTRTKPTIIKNILNNSVNAAAANDKMKRISKIVIKKSSNIESGPKSLSRSPKRMQRNNSSKDLLDTSVYQVKAVVLQHRKNSHSVQPKRRAEDIQITSYRESVSLDGPTVLPGENSKLSARLHQPTDDSYVRIHTDISGIKTTEGGEAKSFVPKRFAQFLSGLDSENRRGLSHNFHITNQGVFGRVREKPLRVQDPKLSEREANKRTLTQEIEDKEKQVQPRETKANNFLMPTLMNMVKNAGKSRYNQNNSVQEHPKDFATDGQKGHHQRGQSMIVYTSES